MAAVASIIYLREPLDHSITTQCGSMRLSRSKWAASPDRTSHATILTDHLPSIAPIIRGERNMLASNRLDAFCTELQMPSRVLKTVSVTGR